MFRFIEIVSLWDKKESNTKSKNIMKKFKHILFLSFLFFIYSSVYGQKELSTDTTQINTPEGIGQYLSELVINRCDIDKSSVALNLNKMLPNEDFSKYKDSPANFILSALISSQYLVTINWNKLLFNADNLLINSNSKYISTYFVQTNKDKYSCIAILKSASKFYSLKFDLLT